MLFDILKYIYLVIAGVLLVFVVIEMFTTRNWRKQVNAAMILVPLILRILLIR